MKKLLSLFFTFMILPSIMHAMVRRSVVKPKAPQHTSQTQVPKRSIVDVRHLKNVHTAIKPEFAHFSPLVGASLINSDYLKKVYQFAPNHPTTRLLNDPKLGLFHLQNTQFRDTQSLSMPGKSLNPELIGEILGHLETGKLTEPQIQADLIKRWKNALHDTFKASISSEKLSQFLKLLQDSKKAESDPEQTRLYIPNMTEGIMTGFLYRKATRKEELCTYLNTLNKHVLVLKKNTDEKMLDDNYSSKELNKRSEKLTKLADDSRKQLKYIEKDFEGTLCALMHHSMEMPSQVLQSSYGYQGQVAVANCTECALHDLCNILLADSSTVSFNLKTLPSTVQLLPELHNFYTNYPSYTSVNNPQVGQDWMDLLSNHSGIIYVQKNYEVECFADNILNLLNRLFNIKAKSWKEFGQLLSDERRAISCKEKIKDKIHTITFSIGDKTFDLVIESGQHTYLNFPQRTSITLDSALNDDTCKSLFRADKNIYLNTLVPLLPSKSYNIKFEHSLSQDLHSLFASILEDQYTIVTALQTISPQAKENPLLRETVLKLVKKLPQDNRYLMGQAILAIIISRAYESIEECSCFINKYLNSASTQDLTNLLDYIVYNHRNVDIDQIKLLLNHGAKVSWSNLTSAIMHKCDIKIINELIKNENNLRKIFFDVSPWGLKDTILALTLRCERFDVANLLLDIIVSSNWDNALKMDLFKIDIDYGSYPLEFILKKWSNTNNSEQKSLYLEIANKLIKLGALANPKSKLDKSLINLVIQNLEIKKT